VSTDILTQDVSKINSVLHIRLFDKKGDAPSGTPRSWAIEVIFIGGAKVTGPLTQAEVTALESDLKDLGWQVDASLFCGGFNAKPPVEVDELIFASSAGLWPDDYGLIEATL
jgi:hypothetical protein